MTGDIMAFLTSLFQRLLLFLLLAYFLKRKLLKG
jgi:flagellar biogenesis protein FliO